MKQFFENVKKHPKFALDTVFHVLFFATLFMILGTLIPYVYYHYFDMKNYYDITSPITVETKEVVQCGTVDAYMHKVVSAPIAGTSIRKLNLVRVDNKVERIATFSTPIQSDMGEATIVIHWQLPCPIKVGTYFFEATVPYMVRDVQKYEHFYTENFNVIATPSAVLIIN